METAELIEKIDKILSNDSNIFSANRKFVDRELLEEIKVNEEVLLYIDQKKGWHKLYHNCWGPISVLEDVAILGCDRSKTFDDCMIFLPTQSKKIKLHVLSRASTLAITSRHYFAIAEKHCPSETGETKEEMLKRAIELIQETEDSTRIIKFLSTSLPYNRNIRIIKSLIMKGLAVAKSFDDVQKVYNLINGWNKRFPQKTSDQFKKLIIVQATKTSIPFAKKETITELIRLGTEDTEMIAKKLMASAMNATA